jgi:hypothetical protein
MMPCFVIKPQKNRDQFSSDHLLSVIVTSNQIFSLEGVYGSDAIQTIQGPNSSPL